MPQAYDVAAYIWPAYTGDEPRSWIFWPEGYGEWRSVRSASAKFVGHTCISKRCKMLSVAHRDAVPCGD